MRTVFLLPVLCLGLAAEVDKPEPPVHRLPILSSVYPQGTTAGQTLRVVVYGEHLDRASVVLFQDTDVKGRVLTASVTTLNLEFTVAPDAKPGPRYFRIVSPRGASNVMLFRVGDQPHFTESEPNSDAARANRVTLPVTINGRLDFDDDYDFFRFPAKAGESWIFDLRAARNGNGLDAALILLDADGRKLQHEEDTFIWDPFFVHRFEQDGEYIAVVQPTHRSNDPNFAYQLDIRQSPWLQTVSPISLAPGEEREVTLHGAGLWDSQAKLEFATPGFAGEVLQARGDSATARVRVPAGAGEAPHDFVVVTRTGRSNPSALIVDSTPRHAGGDTLSLPAAMDGVARYRRPERFWFTAQAGQRLVFEVRAHRFGAPTDSVLRIFDREGKQIAMNDDANLPGVAFNKDSRLMHTFDEAGRYQVEVRNVSAVTGENFPYHLRIGPPEPSAGLMLATDQPYVYPDEKGQWKINAVRTDGFDQEIPLEIRGLPEGVGLDGAAIPAGKNDTTLELTANGLRPGEWAEVEVVSPVADGPAWRSVRISSGGGEGATFAPVRKAALAVVEKPMFSLEAQTRALPVVRGGMAEFLVTVVWREGFGETVRLQAENLPKSVEMVPAMVRPMEESVKITLKAAKDAPVGRAGRVSVVGVAENGHTQAAPKIAVQVD